MNKLYDIDNDIKDLNEIELESLLLYGNSEKYSAITNTSILNCSIAYIQKSERFDGPLL